MHLPVWRSIWLAVLGGLTFGFALGWLLVPGHRLWGFGMLAATILLHYIGLRRVSVRVREAPCLEEASDYSYCGLPAGHEGPHEFTIDTPTFRPG